MTADLPSKSAINAAGRYLAVGRGLTLGSPEWREWHDWERITGSLAVVEAFRSAHQKPLSIATVGLRQFVMREVDSRPVVSQRLKRVPRIIRKLHRTSQSAAGASALARLEDIGGCRAILPDAWALDRVARRLLKAWEPIIVRSRDYITAPNEMGYRAAHFVITKQDRRIEVQLRTRGQQAWANAIEAADSRHGLTLKDGVGPESMLSYFAVAGDMIYHRDYGVTPPPELNDRLKAATDLVTDEGYYSRRSK